jgi:pSer/pThr/pTyr-binding forkhead associated (FHA) protein
MRQFEIPQPKRRKQHGQVGQASGPSVDSVSRSKAGCFLQVSHLIRSFPADIRAEGKFSWTCWERRTMQVKLRVCKGKSAGKEVKIATPKFLIGRSQECHLRANSDAISRRHCVLIIKDNKVYIRDLKSRNGTYVNGERLQKDSRLRPGDVIRVGRLEFECVIDHSLGGEKRPKVKDVKEAAARAAQGASGDKVSDSSIEFDITQWLEEADETEFARKSQDPDTRQFKLDDTSVPLESVEPSLEDTREEPAAKSEESSEKDEKKKKKQYGKLPQRPAATTVDSRDAAAQTLRKFFTGR